MTIKELIEELKKFDENLEINFYYEDDCGDSYEQACVLIDYNKENNTIDFKIGS